MLPCSCSARACALRCASRWYGSFSIAGIAAQSADTNLAMALAFFPLYFSLVAGSVRYALKELGPRRLRGGRAALRAK